MVAWKLWILFRSFKTIYSLTVMLHIKILFLPLENKKLIHIFTEPCLYILWSIKLVVSNFSLKLARNNKIYNFSRARHHNWSYQKFTKLCCFLTMFFSPVWFGFRLLRALFHSVPVKLCCLSSLCPHFWGIKHLPLFVTTFVANSFMFCQAFCCKGSTTVITGG